jgi:hypothetical protein
VRDLQHFFRRGRFFSIVLPPNEGKILVHLLSPAIVRPLSIDHLAALELGANDRSAGLSDCPSKSRGAAARVLMSAPDKMTRCVLWQKEFWGSVDVRFGSKAGMTACLRDVRFTPKSGHC